MSRELQPPVLSVSLVKIEPPIVIKNEPPESEIVEIGIDDILDSSESEEEIIPDVKGIDIVYHPVCEDFMKSEILESYHCESVEIQVLVNAENSPFIKTENITQRNKTDDTSDANVTKGIGQGVVEVQASHEHSQLESDKQSVLNFSKDLNSVSVRSRKSKIPKKKDFGECYKTDGTTLWEKEKEKIKVIKAPVIPVEAHEYTSLVNGKHVCNHCQHASNRLRDLREHIEKNHREVTTMYQCPYCLYQSKWKQSLKPHIIQKHKDTKDIQWFQHDCDNCSYKTYRLEYLKRHKLVHLKPEEIQYLYCYHCSHKFKRKRDLKNHIFRNHFKNVNEGKRYGCNKCDYETYTSTQVKSHKLTHLKPEEIQYFYCYHCSYKSKRKGYLKEHIFRHFKKEQVKFDCYICNFVTPKRESIIKHIKKHSKV